MDNGNVEINAPTMKAAEEAKSIIKLLVEAPQPGTVFRWADAMG